jgi:hypothetical protein
MDKTRHKVAFCAQNPCASLLLILNFLYYIYVGLEHATIRDNILFGSHFVNDRYQAVLDACALRPDLAILDAGDATGGINLHLR